MQLSCGFCSGAAALQCERCDFAYCGKRCQVADWVTGGHAAVCGNTPMVTVPRVNGIEMADAMWTTEGGQIAFATELDLPDILGWMEKSPGVRAILTDMKASNWFWWRFLLAHHCCDPRPASMCNTYDPDHPYRQDVMRAAAATLE